MQVLLLVTAAFRAVGQTSTAPSPTDDKDVANLLAGMDEATMNRRSVRTILFGLHRVSDRDFSQQESCMLENLRVVADAKNAECYYVCLGLPGGLARKGCCAPGSQFLLPNATNVLGDCSMQPGYVTSTVRKTRWKVAAGGLGAIELEGEASKLDERTRVRGEGSG